MRYVDDGGGLGHGGGLLEKLGGFQGRGCGSSDNHTCLILSHFWDRSVPWLFLDLC